MDVEFPDRFLPAIRIVVINLVWILPLIALERAADGYDEVAAIFGLLWLADLVIAVTWGRLGRLFATGNREVTLALLAAAIIGLLLAGGAIGALAVRGRLFAGETSAGIATTTQTTASAAPTPSTEVQGATLRLLLRPNQDPQEQAKDNVWRWFVFKTMGQAPDGKLTTLATYIFITFDKPVQTNYRRVFSPSNPALHFDVPDLTARSMIVTINNIDLAGETVEINVSGSPL
jgi:hypothetical protein